MIALFIPGTPESQPPAEGCMIHSKQHWWCRIQDLGTPGKHQTRKNPWRTSTRGVGCRIQEVGIRGYRWWKTAYFSHSARCSPFSCQSIPSRSTPPPLAQARHGRGPRSPAKTAVQRSPRAQTRPCMRVTHVTARPGRTLLALAENHIRTSSMGFQWVVQCCYEQNAPSQTLMSPSFPVQTLYRHPILHSGPQKQGSQNFLKTAVQRPPCA